jgi:hypothetical protein
MLYCQIVLLLYCDIVVLSYCSVMLMMFLFYLLCCCPLMILFILPNISGCSQVHAGTERMLACRLQTSGRDIKLTAYGEGYDENLHSLMQTFWGVFSSGQITQNITCTICSCVTTRVESFSAPIAIFRITS